MRCKTLDTKKNFQNRGNWSIVYVFIKTKLIETLPFFHPSFYAFLTYRLKIFETYSTFFFFSYFSNRPWRVYVRRWSSPSRNWNRIKGRMPNEYNRIFDFTWRPPLEKPNTTNAPTPNPTFYAIATLYPLLWPTLNIRKDLLSLYTWPNEIT